MFKFIMMSCGYVESCHTSTLIYGVEFMGGDGFKTCHEAITELALDLFAKFYTDCMSVYERRYARDVKECCREALIANKAAQFCSSCGSKIQDRFFDPEEFREYVQNLHSSTCDSYGDAEWSNDRDLVWWPWSIREFLDAGKDEIVLIAENAEHVLLTALLEAKPELKTLDDEYEGYSADDWEKFKSNKQPSYT